MMNVIEVNKLVTKYGARVIHNELTFNIQKGEIFVILGGSGCGKSTLLKHLSRLLMPSSGQILIDGTDVTFLHESSLQEAMRPVGFMFQSGALFGSLTLLENVAVPLFKFTKLDKETVKAISRVKLGMVGLGGFEGYYPHEISGGMKKRAGVARAMALDPKILLLDEPSAGLDPISADELDDLILGLNRALGITFVIVTHELQSIFKVAQRVIMLGRGNILAEGDPNLLKDSEKPWVSDFFNRRGKFKQYLTSNP
ncbi:MAG: ATP-binding cassette domain-containing protein [SAR324 cluster bacterium]|nr:ATP-binding cassette domain-containing protein [SAR324 cluster bacterium]